MPYIENPSQYSSGDSISKGRWRSNFVNAALGLSYKFDIGRLYAKPSLIGEYFFVKEAAHYVGDNDRDDRVQLHERTSDEALFTPAVALGYMLSKNDSGGMALEVEGGYRKLVGGELGRSIASTDVGDRLAFSSTSRESGRIARLRLIQRSEGFAFGGELSAEQRFGREAISLRVSTQARF